MSAGFPFVPLTAPSQLPVPNNIYVNFLYISRRSKIAAYRLG
jgi:hypothetical protein